MRVEVFGNGYEVSVMLRTCAESRVWLAVNRPAEHLSWVGVRLMNDDGHALRDRVVCRLYVWLRGIGLVTVRHTDVDPYVAIDRAAVRLEQAVVRKLREAAPYCVVTRSHEHQTAGCCVDAGECLNSRRTTSELPPG